jgi:ribose 5-phosphate isomerase B
VKTVENRRIAIAADHAGFYLKEKIIGYLRNEKLDLKDFGTDSPESVDYPDFGHRLAEAVSSGDYDMGFTICATGNGMNITVNKHQGIRGALCWSEETSRLARAHNDANICSIPARFVSDSEALLIVKTFLETGFDEGRHRRRIEKIPIKMY